MTFICRRSTTPMVLSPAFDVYAFCTWSIQNRGYNFVGAQIDDVHLPCGEMRREQIVIVGRNGEVVETLAGRSRQIELRHLLESAATGTRHECQSTGQRDKSDHQNSFVPHTKPPVILFGIFC